jgi:hypothetical protein
MCPDEAAVRANIHPTEKGYEVIVKTFDFD